MASFTRTGTDNRYVTMTHGQLTVDFDTWFGGAPLRWRYSGQDIINTHAGEGFQNTVEEGQDLTQASSNGETVYRICRTTDNYTDNLYRNYWGRETLPSGWPSGATYYKLTGFYPDFWLSHQAPDDALPRISSGTAQNGWITKYTNPSQWQTWCNEIGFPARGGGPIFFTPTANQSSGILMEGNEMKIPIASYNWNDRLRAIPNGRVAFRCRISFARASADAWAGVLFRRSVPAGAGKYMNDAFNAPGYSLNINAQGGLELRRTDSANPIWSASSVPGLTTTIQQAVAQAPGCLIEVRTANTDLSYFEIWVQEARVAYFNNSNPFTGSHFGLVAYTGSIGGGQTPYVKFSDRDVVNLGTQVETTYTPQTDGSVEVDTYVRRADGVSVEGLFYRINQVAFLADPTNLNWVWTESAPGVILNPKTSTGSYVPNIDGAPNAVYAIMAGRNNGTLGTYVKSIQVTCTGSGVPNPAGAHAFVASPPASGVARSIVHLNALPQNPVPNNPWSLSTIRLKARWFGSHP